MPGSHHGSPVLPDAHGRGLLDFVHGLLLRADDARGLDSLLADLARAAGADAAGLALVPADGAPLVQQRVAPGGAAAPARWPWDDEPDLPARLCQATSGLPVRTSDGADWLIAAAAQPGQASWLLWLEAAGGRDWGPAEGAALALAGQALLRHAQAGRAATWARQLDRAACRQRLEDAAVIVRRLAHDFGNVLTSILGFTELSLNEAPRGSSLHDYLQEVYRGTQQGAELTAQLRLFTRRGAPPAAATPLAPLVEAEAFRLRTAWAPDVRLEVRLPGDLPSVAMDSDHLRQTLLPLLANAREAIAGAGTVALTAGPAELSPADCLDLLGNPRPGRCLEVTVRDTGCGLSAEAARRVLAEPFFTTKARHRGLGLATVYGLLHLHRGGFCLEPGPGGGAVARLCLPVVGAAEPAPGPPALAAGRGEKVLVVDDDPLVLKMVCATLERAGYRVRPVAGGAEALEAFADPDPEPFRLVLSDVLMPRMSGVDLARQLLRRDAGVNLLFMSGQVSADFARENFHNWHFSLLEKPFRADGLLSAVRTALDRPAGTRRAASGASAAAP
jgi:signal transduction histidine kinase/ActR/RegA family two-component response regulator